MHAPPFPVTEGNGAIRDVRCDVNRQAYTGTCRAPCDVNPQPYTGTCKAAPDHHSLPRIIEPGSSALAD